MKDTSNDDALAAEKSARVGALSAALTSRVAWDRVLRQVSLVLPEDVWLTNLAATAPSPAAAARAPSTGTSGFTLTGSTYSQNGVARFLSRLSRDPRPRERPAPVERRASSSTSASSSSSRSWPTCVGRATPPGCGLMKRKLDTRTLSVLAGICILLYGAAGYFLVVSPKKGEASTTRRGDRRHQRRAGGCARRAEAQDDTQPIAVADIFRLATAMPSSPDMPGILLELSRIADETGIRFKSITPQTALAVGAYQSVPIDVTFDGSFYALSDFLFRLRTLVSVRRGELHAAGRLFSVETVDFSEGETGFPMLAASLKLQAYVYGAGRAQAPRCRRPSTRPRRRPRPKGPTVPPATAAADASAGATG